MKAKEGIHHRRETSLSSVPSSPRSINPTHGRHASTDSTDFKEIPLLPRKPMPNYLRPTISSTHNGAPATKSLVRRRSTDKLASHASPPLPHHPLRARSSSASEKTPKAASSPSSKALVPGKSMKTYKSGMSPQSSKAARASKKAAVNPVEKVLCIDNGSGPAREDDHSAIRSGSYFSPRKGGKQAVRTTTTKDDDCAEEHYEASGESLAGGEEGDIGRARLRRVKSLSVDSSNDGSPRRLNIWHEREKEEEKVALKKEKEVTEETASKVAGKRRSKVAALVGAFETVISLREPESDQPQLQQEGETAAAEDEVKLDEEVTVADERVDDDMAMAENEVKLDEEAAVADERVDDVAMAEDEVKLDEEMAVADERVDDDVAVAATNEEAVVDKADEEREHDVAVAENGVEEVVEEGAEAKEEESVGDEDMKREE